MRLPSIPSKIQHLVFNQDATLLAADYVAPDTTADKPHIVLKVWDAASGKELLTADSGDIISGLAVSPKARVAWVTGGRTRVWDAASGKQSAERAGAVVYVPVPVFQCGRLAAGLGWAREWCMYGMWTRPAKIRTISDHSDVFHMALGARQRQARSAQAFIFDEIEVQDIAVTS